MSTRRSPLLSSLRLSLLLSLACLILLTNSSSGPASAQAPLPTKASSGSSSSSSDVLVLRVYYADRTEYINLAAEFGLHEAQSALGYLTLTADRATYDQLKARGLRVEIDEAATKYAIENPPVMGNNADTFFNGYHTVEEMQTYLDEMVAQYPTLAQKVDFGDSWCKVNPTTCTQPNTYAGYDLLAIRITNQNITGTKPLFWFNAGLHPRELVPPEIALKYISWLLDGYSTNADARWLVDWNEIWIVPMSNPDGHHITENGESTPRTQRKNANKSLGCTTYPPTGSSQFGVDLNRNFAFKWNCCGGSSGTPCNLTYRGPSPASEPETQFITAQRNLLFADQRGPGDNDPAAITTTGAFLDMHSNARLTLYPWGQTSDPSPNAADLRNIAKHMSAPSLGGNGYHMEQAVGLYPTDGAIDDAAYGDLGVIAFTIELNSGGSFTPPYTTVETDWNANRAALIHLSKIARQPYLLTRGPDTNTAASSPNPVIQGTPSTLTASINYNWSHTDPVEPNTYLQNVAAAEYYIDTPPWAGGTPIAMTAVDGSFNSSTEAVQATVNTASLAPGRHILMVRGRGVNDYQGYQSWGAITATFLDILPGGGGTSTPTSVPPTSTSISTSTSTSIPTSTPTNDPAATPSPTRTISPIDLEPQMAYFPATQSCSGTTPGYFSLTTLKLGNGTVPVTTTMRLSDEHGNFVHFPVPPMTLTYYNTQYHCNGAVPCPNDIPTVYTITVDYFDDFWESNETNNNFSQTLVQPILNTVTPCTASPTPTGGATNTATAVSTGTAVSTVTGTAIASITPTACTIAFTDVPEGSTFYPFVQCMACRGIITGYTSGCDTGDPCFRPSNNVTRGQLSKIVANAAGFADPVGSQQFEDVPPGSTFFDFIWRLADRGIVAGYPCGGAGEPCGGGNLPYFRPNNNVTRGQISKIVSEAAGYNDTPTGQQFEDVPVGSTFYDWIWRLADRAIMSGYVCGGPGEPCGGDNLPYFRPGANATRGQASKIVSNTFFPECTGQKR